VYFKPYPLAVAITTVIYGDPIERLQGLTLVFPGANC
jgi:hypothetical protein